MSASTAVLLKASIGIYALFKNSFCWLNYWVIKLASSREGTAKVFLYGVLIGLSSSMMRYLIVWTGVLMIDMFWFAIQCEGGLFVESLHIVLGV